ncbi:hypothetical protein F4806DRAFT_57591 [Annulohypoxylon nitens]|nr:hypothetical protein F4806DRAFT_57591 [Annulohypoxylon nitens]
MSFGFSIGDFLTIINGVGKIISRLRGGASSEYRHYQEIYDNFVQVARFLNDYGNSWNSILGEDIKRIQKLLQYFLYEISRHEPYFDKRKRRAWLHRTTRRLLWPFYSDKLKDLNKYLTSLMSSIMFKKQFLQGNPNFSKIFFLEDARGDTHTIDFVSISSWEVCANLLSVTTPVT